MRANVFTSNTIRAYNAQEEWILFGGICGGGV